MEAEGCAFVTHKSSYEVLVKKSKHAGDEVITVVLMIQKFCSVMSCLLASIYPSPNKRIASIFRIG